MTSRVFVNPYYKPSTSYPPSNPEIRVFHQSLPHYSPTPLLSLSKVAKDIGVGHVVLKDESNRLGLAAFKILGASWATTRSVLRRLNLGIEDVKSDDSASGTSLSRLASAAQVAGLTLYAATDGNHGRAVALMAKYLGIKARIFVPSMLDEEAISKIRGEGALVEVHNGDYDQTVRATKVAAEKHPEGTGLLISDTALVFGDETAQWIVDGYQTMFDEIEEQIVDITGQRRITHVFTPVGVGSLAQAVVTHFGRTPRSEKPLVLSVEPESAACLKSSLEAGKVTSIITKYTICSGMCCGTLSMNGWPILKDGITAAMTVDDNKVDKAIRELQTYDIQAGPCGSAALAGLKQVSIVEGFHLGPDSVVLILCTEGARGYHMEE